MSASTRLIFTIAGCALGLVAVGTVKTVNQQHLYIYIYYAYICIIYI
jgi:hypothetical protein